MPLKLKTSRQFHVVSRGKLSCTTPRLYVYISQQPSDISNTTAKPTISTTTSATKSQMMFFATSVTPPPKPEKSHSYSGSTTANGPFAALRPAAKPVYAKPTPQEPRPTTSLPIHPARHQFNPSSTTTPSRRIATSQKGQSSHSPTPSAAPSSPTISPPPPTPKQPHRADPGTTRKSGTAQPRLGSPVARSHASKQQSPQPCPARGRVVHCRLREGCR